MRKKYDGSDFKADREKMGLTKTDVAMIMRIPNPELIGYRTITRWEGGNVPGAAITAMAALKTGWRPAWFKK